MSTYVDNLFSCSCSAEGAIKILQDAEGHLRTQWGHSMKPSSRMVMVCRGCPEVLQDDPLWPMVTSFPCLGHVLQDDGGIRECFSNTKRIMWRAFWGNCGERSLRKASVSLKLSLLNRACRSVLRYRCSRWPPQPTFAVELDRLQTKMVAAMMRTPRLPGETAQDFCRRRNISAATHCRSSGRWSHDWFARSTRWDQHIQRSHVPHCWLMLMRSFQDSLWLESCRALSQAHGTTTRVCRGRPCMRWHEGIQYASSALRA